MPSDGTVEGVSDTVAQSSFETVSRSPTLVERVAEQLSSAIISGELATGSRLPSERDLGEQLGVSRTVVREAVRALAARGLVRVTSGRGVEVAGLGTGLVSDSLRLFMQGSKAFGYEQIHEFRETVEVAVAGVAAERAADLEVAHLRRLWDDHAQHVAARAWDAASEADVEFHRALAAASGNPLFTIVLDAVADVLREVRQRTYATPGVGEAGLDEHRAILERIEAGDVAGARAAMADHLARAHEVYERRDAG